MNNLLKPYFSENKLSATLLINEKSKQLLKEGKKIYKLCFGQSPFPVPESVVNELKKEA